MKVKPKEIFVNLPTVLLLDSEDKAGEFSSNVNTFIHGKVHMKYDILGVLGEQIAVIFYLQRNDEFHSLRDQFMDLIEREELIKDQPSLQELQIEKDQEDDMKMEIVAGQIYPYADDQENEENDRQIHSLFLSKDEMSKLTTQRLLAYKKKLYKYPEGPDWETDDNMNKSRPEWQEAYKNIKEVLSNREHVEKKC